MPRMTLRAVHGDGERRRLPLSERIVDENLGSFRRVPQRGSATADAEVLASRSADRAEERHDDAARHAHVDDRTARGTRRRRHVGEHDAELVDAAWLFAWSYADLVAGREVPARASDRGRVSRLGARRG
jgi:hypothetical protein